MSDEPANDSEAAVDTAVRRGSALIGVVVVVQLVANVGFWVAASRSNPSAIVGDASELVAGLQFVVYLGGLGLTLTNSRFGTEPSPRADALLTWSLLLATAAALVSSAGYLATLELLQGADLIERPELLELVTATPLGVAGLFVLVAGTAWGLLVDVRLMAMRRFDVLIGRAVAIGVGRIAFLAFPHATHDALWLFSLSAIPTVLYAVSGVAWLHWRHGLSLALDARPEPLRPIVRFAGVNYVATLAMEAPLFVLPVIVSTWLSGTEYANFFVAWSAAAAGLLLPGAIAQIALVEGSRVSAQGLDRTRTAMVVAVGVGVVAVVGAAVGNDVVPIVYGDDYELAARHLPYFMLAAIPWAIASVLLSRARVRRDHATTAAIALALGFGSIVPALVLVPRHGTSGAIWAWVGGTSAAAIAAVASSLRQRRAALLGDL
jgi:O-antigen/teichoic acid export membrane protein